MKLIDLDRMVQKDGRVSALTQVLATYKAEREVRAGVSKLITIELRVNSAGSYQAVVTDEDGRQAWSSVFSVPDSALETIPWADLDKDAT